MNRVAPLAASFLLALAAVGCAAEAPSPSLGGSTHEEKGDDGKESENDSKKVEEPSGGGGTIIGGDLAAAGEPSTTKNAALPATKLLPDGDVRTTKGCTAVGTGFTPGNGKITRTTRDVKGFVSVAIGLSGNVVLQEGSTFGVQIEIDENLQDQITTSVNAKGTLLVENSGSICTGGGTRVLVTLPKLANAGVYGSADMEITKLTSASDVKLVVDGSGSIRFNGSAANLTLVIQGSGDIVLDKGSASATKALVQGSGDVTRQSFQPGSVSQQVSGSGGVNL